jgi:hypothetical protein
MYLAKTRTFTPKLKNYQNETYFISLYRISFFYSEQFVWTSDPFTPIYMILSIDKVFFNLI